MKARRCRTCICTHWGLPASSCRESRGRSSREEAAARDARLCFQEDADDVLAREALMRRLRASVSSDSPAARCRADRGVLLERRKARRRIESWRRIAERLGLGLNALRNRALRLRDMLEQCIGQRLAAGDESARSDTHG